VVLVDCRAGHLVLHGGDGLGGLGGPRVGDDDHRARRLGAETAGGFAEFASRRRAGSAAG